MNPRSVDVAIVGGGIAGLTAAWHAHKRGLSVRLLESAPRVGGKIQSGEISPESGGAFRYEAGPNSFLGSAATLWQLIEELGLEPQVLAGLPPGDRYIYRNRRARRLPRGPGDLLRPSADFMSFGGRLRLLAEPFVMGDARETDTVMGFAKRRLGEEAAQYLVAPFVSGIYAGDAEELGAHDAFPTLWQWEQEAGSVLLGAIFGRKATPGTALVAGEAKPSAKPKRRRGMFTFKEGLEVLPRALAAALPAGSVLTDAWVRSIELQDDGQHILKWHTTQEPEGLQAIRARHVVLATPPGVTAGILPADAQLAQTREALVNVFLCRVAVVILGGKVNSGTPPQGFGMLVPPGEGLRTLGILFPSSVFADRAPEGHWIHAGFLGGARDPDAVDLPDETLLALVRRAQDQAFPEAAGGALSVDFCHVVRWPNAIPQYRVGHRAAMQEARATLEAHLPGVALAGNYLDGISVNDAAASGIAAVDRALAATAGTSGARTATGRG